MVLGSQGLASGHREPGTLRLSDPTQRPLRVSRFHRLLQEIVAEYLTLMGFKADIEVSVDDVHVADVYATDGERDLIVEVETGYVPPTFIESAEEYIAARLTVKTYSYSGLADEFYIATPSYLRLPIPRWLSRCEEPLPDELVGLLSKFYGPRQLKGLLEGGLDKCKGLAGLMSVTIYNRTVRLWSLNRDAPVVMTGPGAWTADPQGDDLTGWTPHIKRQVSPTS